MVNDQQIFCAVADPAFGGPGGRPRGGHRAGRPAGRVGSGRVEIS